MRKQKIKSIEKGWGDDSTYYTTDERVKEFAHYVDEIKKETKKFGCGIYTDLSMDVYRGYKNGKMVFEIESNSNLTIIFF